MVQEKFERWLIPIMKDLTEKTTVTLKDMDGFFRSVEHVIMKIERQRERLEKSRDDWKRKYLLLKNGK